MSKSKHVPREKITAALKKGGMTEVQLRDDLSKYGNDVGKSLLDMVARGTLVREGDLYMLPSHSKKTQYLSQKMPFYDPLLLIKKSLPENLKKCLVSMDATGAGKRVLVVDGVVMVGENAYTCENLSSLNGLYVSYRHNEWTDPVPKLVDGPVLELVY